jgi:hypothetical protein
MAKWNSSLLFGLVLATSHSVAQIEREYGQHVHGESNAEIVIESNVVTVDMSLPGINVVGFEHAPRTPDDEAAIDAALAFFRTEPWVRFSPQAGCEVISINAHTHGFDADHAHDHTHAHADFHILLTATCQDSRALGWMEVDVFTAFPGNELLRADVLAEDLAVRARLTAGQTRIHLH